jgi:muconolactone delta-isomerase
MLFHVTMTHSAATCPGYDQGQMPGFIAGAEKLEAVAQELQVKVHALLWAAPEHVAYALLEADSPAAVGRYLFTLPLRQEFKVTPVQNLQDVIAMGKAMMAQTAR